jgi:hypothetical protein
VLADQLERRPDERDAQLVVAVVDAPGDMASADPTSLPVCHTQGDRELA